MKNAKILTLLLFYILMAVNSKAAVYINKTDANCECNGTIEVRGTITCGYTTSKTAVSFISFNENSQQWEEERLNLVPYDPPLPVGHNFDETYLIENLCPGTYKVTYEFVGLVDSQGNDIWMSMNTPDYWVDVVIDGPEQFLSAEIEDVTQGACWGDGEASIIVEGGSEPINIEWKRDGNILSEGENETSLTNLTNGSYEIIVTDANGCEQVLTFSISGQEDQITYDKFVQHSGCDGENTGQIKICNVLPEGSMVWEILQSLSGHPHAQGTQEDDCMVWNDLPPGDWRVIIISPLGCTIEPVITIEDYEELIIEANVVQSGCNGQMNSGIIEVEVLSGTAPFVYSWDHDSNLSGNKAENLAPGIYKVLVTDANGCEKELEVIINQVESLEIQVALRDKPNGAGGCCSEATLLIDNGTPPYIITWGDGSSGQKNEICSWPATHTVTVEDANGCKITQQVVNIECNLVILISPNPSTGVFYVGFDLDSPANVEFEIWDNWVKIDDFDAGNLPAGSHNIQMSTNVGIGVYYFVIRTNGIIIHESELIEIQ